MAGAGTRAWTPWMLRQQKKKRSAASVGVIPCRRPGTSWTAAAPSERSWSALAPRIMMVAYVQTSPAATSVRPSLAVLLQEVGVQPLTQLVLHGLGRVLRHGVHPAGR